MDNLSFCHTKQNYQRENIHKSTYYEDNKFYLDLESFIKYGKSNKTPTNIMDKKNINNKSIYQSPFNYNQQNLRNNHFNNDRKLKETDINKEFISDIKQRNKQEDYMFRRLSEKKNIKINEFKNDSEIKISKIKFIEEDSKNFQSILTTVKAVQINGNEKSSENFSEKVCNMQKVSKMVI